MLMSHAIGAGRTVANLTTLHRRQDDVSSPGGARLSSCWTSDSRFPESHALDERKVARGWRLQPEPRVLVHRLAREIRIARPRHTGRRCAHVHLYDEHR